VTEAGRCGPVVPALVDPTPNAGIYVNKKEKYIVLNSQTLQQINEKISANRKAYMKTKVLHRLN
jgi:hypothetical protein